MLCKVFWTCVYHITNVYVTLAPDVYIYIYDISIDKYVSLMWNAQLFLPSLPPCYNHGCYNRGYNLSTYDTGHIVAAPFPCFNQAVITICILYVT